MGLDVRVNTDILTNSERLSISADANMALIMLQAHALNHDSDGFVPSKAVAERGNYHGVPFVTVSTVDELVEVGLAERVEGGIQVVWEWQTTAEYRESQKARNRKKSKDYRERQKDTNPTPSVTGDEPVTDRRVGKDRTGKERQGQERDRTSMYDYPSVPPKDFPTGSYS